MEIHVSGLFGVLLLILDVWAIVKTIESNGTTGQKVFWIVFILLLPILGLLAWYFLGPKREV